MGHGDTLVIADTNFPSDAIARQTRLGHLLHIDNVSAARAVKAVLSVLPLDSALQNSAGRMEVMGAADDLPPVQQEVQAEVDAAEAAPRRCMALNALPFMKRPRRLIASSPPASGASMAVFC